MNFIITLLILIFILGILVFVHELGHFIMAKKYGVHVYEFALGMGPQLFKFKRKNKKDDTTYSIRLFPIGGFVSMANVEVKGEKIKKDKILENKSFSKKFVILIAGIIMNFLLAIILLFLSGLIFGSPITKPYVGEVNPEYPAYKAGIEKGDLILEVDGKSVNKMEDILLLLTVKDVKTSYIFKIQKPSGSLINTTIYPEKVIKDDVERYVFGISSSIEKEYGVVAALKYTYNKFIGTCETMGNILSKLFTGQIGMDKLSGPVGMYQVIDDMKATGAEGIIYLIAFLSINIGFINLIPIPVFDGGRILLIIIEKLKGSKLNPNIEGYLNLIGFFLLILLTVYVTFNDILKLF